MHKLVLVCPCSVPVLFYLKSPLPLQMFVLIVIREETANAVNAPCHHALRSLLHRRRVALHLNFRRVGANHVNHLIHWDRHSGSLLHVLQSVNYLALYDKVDSDAVLDTLLNHKRLLLKARQIAGQVQFHIVPALNAQCQFLHNHFAAIRGIYNRRVVSHSRQRESRVQLRRPISG